MEDEEEEVLKNGVESGEEKVEVVGMNGGKKVEKRELKGDWGIEKIIGDIGSSKKEVKRKVKVKEDIEWEDEGKRMKINIGKKEMLK